MNPRTAVILGVLKTPLPDIDVFNIDYTCSLENLKSSCILKGFLEINSEEKEIFKLELSLKDFMNMLSITGKEPLEIDKYNNTIINLNTKKQLIKAQILLPECTLDLEFEGDSPDHPCKMSTSFGTDISDFLRSCLYLDTTK